MNVSAIRQSAVTSLSVRGDIPAVPRCGQRRITDHLRELSTETQRLEAVCRQRLDLLSKLKQSVLRKAFAGELTARPEKPLQEAAE